MSKLVKHQASEALFPDNLYTWEEGYAGKGDLEDFWGLVVVVLVGMVVGICIVPSSQPWAH